MTGTPGHARPDQPAVAFATAPDCRGVVSDGEPAAAGARSNSATALSQPRNNATSLRRALAILEILAEDPRRPVRSLGELAGPQGLHKSTTLRLLAPLIDVGVVQRAADGSGYSLGPTTIRLGQAYLDGVDLRAAAQPALSELARTTGETVHLVVYNPPEVVYVEKIDSLRAVRMHSRVGDRQPVYSTAVGKAYLSRLSDDEVSRAVGLDLRRRTANTITDLALLLAELKHVAAQGFAIDNEENELEIRCVGAVVIDHSGAVAAGLSVSAPASRLSLAHARNLGTTVVAAAVDISAALGNADALARRSVRGR